MILSSLLAAVFTFTATATGVEKGTPIEFFFAGVNSDRDYESMFLVDGSLTDFCRAIETAGFPRGKPISPDDCRLWPVGCRVSFEPALERFVAGTVADGGVVPVIYTGGARNGKGRCEADETMPAACFSTYTLAQSPFVYDGVFDQGAVYGRFTAAITLKKGEKVSFSVVCDERTMPRKLEYWIEPGRAAEVLKQIRSESQKGDLDIKIGFGDNLLLEEAVSVARALATIDSARIRINGYENIFYQAFLPLIKWRDRKERLQQPFELSLSANGNDTLLFIAEDWSVEGDDPKLTPQTISYADTVKHPKTDTCFIFADPKATVKEIRARMNKFPESQIKKWYVFAR